ncbi:hypothetical protein GCM10010193_63420 [Kitasatospora atroaurantiaca]
MGSSFGTAFVFGAVCGDESAGAALAAPADGAAAALSGCGVLVAAGDSAAA